MKNKTITEHTINGKRFKKVSIWSETTTAAKAVTAVKRFFKKYAEYFSIGLKENILEMLENGVYVYHSIKDGGTVNFEIEFPDNKTIYVSVIELTELETAAEEQTAEEQEQTAAAGTDAEQETAAEEQTAATVETETTATAADAVETGKEVKKVMTMNDIRKVFKAAIKNQTNADYKDILKSDMNCFEKLYTEKTITEYNSSFLAFVNSYNTGVYPALHVLQTLDLHRITIDDKKTVREIAEAFLNYSCPIAMRNFENEKRNKAAETAAAEQQPETTTAAASETGTEKRSSKVDKRTAAAAENISCIECSFENNSNNIEYRVFYKNHTSKVFENKLSKAAAAFIASAVISKTEFTKYIATENDVFHNSISITDTYVSEATETVFKAYKVYTDNMGNRYPIENEYRLSTFKAKADNIRKAVFAADTEEQETAAAITGQETAAAAAEEQQPETVTEEQETTAEASAASEQETAATEETEAAEQETGKEVLEMTGKETGTAATADIKVVCGIDILADRKISIDNFISSLDEKQVIVVYNEKHNIHYVGTAENAPVFFSWMLFDNAIFNYHEIIINGAKLDSSSSYKYYVFSDAAGTDAAAAIIAAIAEETETATAAEQEKAIFNTAVYIPVVAEEQTEAEEQETEAAGTAAVTEEQETTAAASDTAAEQQPELSTAAEEQQKQLKLKAIEKYHVFYDFYTKIENIAIVTIITIAVVFSAFAVVFWTDAEEQETAAAASDTVTEEQQQQQPELSTEEKHKQYINRCKKLIAEQEKAIAENKKIIENNNKIIEQLQKKTETAAVSAAVVTDIMNELETELTAAGFNIDRISNNYMIINDFKRTEAAGTDAEETTAAAAVQ